MVTQTTMGLATHHFSLESSSDTHPAACLLQALDESIEVLDSFPAQDVDHDSSGTLQYSMPLPIRQRGLQPAADRRRQFIGGGYPLASWQDREHVGRDKKTGREILMGSPLPQVGRTSAL